jgi:thiamine biosynthesis protein ThiI
MRSEVNLQTSSDSASSASSSAEERPYLVLIRYGELALKGKNRGFFERKLASNIRSACEGLSKVRVELRRGRIMVWPEQKPERVAKRLQDVMGIQSVSLARGVPLDPELIAEEGLRSVQEALEECPADEIQSFRVATRRGNKNFQMTSSELDCYVADRVLPELEKRLKVQLKGADLVLGIEVREKNAFIFTKRLPGPGGLPVGTLGHVLCLLSGGIDSPVAAWMAMKRGCRVSYVTYHSSPYLGDASRKKVVDLVRILAQYQPTSQLFVVPFTACQEAIRDFAPERYRTVLYRRMMQRIATRLARRNRCGALVTGESLGQVASQTLENITCIEDASGLPVIRPLIAMDKQESVNLAQRIGTYDTSIEPAPDCCTVFQPEKPIIYGRIEECLEAETSFDLDELLTEALRGTERIKVRLDD